MLMLLLDAFMGYLIGNPYFKAELQTKTTRPKWVTSHKTERKKQLLLQYSFSIWSSPHSTSFPPRDALTLIANNIQPTSWTWTLPSLWMESERRSSTVISSPIGHFVVSAYRHASCQYMNAFGLLSCFFLTYSSPELQNLQKADTRSHLLKLLVFQKIHLLMY